MALLADAREGAGQCEEDDLPPREELVEGRAGEACARRVWCSRRLPARPAGLRRKWAKKAAKEATTHRRTPRPRRPPRPRPTCACRCREEEESTTHGAIERSAACILDHRAALDAR